MTGLHVDNKLLDSRLNSDKVSIFLSLSSYLKSLKLKAAQGWYCLDHPEIPPDNNLAERLIRLAVTKRKVCGGSRSMLRFEQTADLLSVIQSCRRQARSAFEFFKQALSACHHDSVVTPSLIPKLTT